MLILFQEIVTLYIGVHDATLGDEDASGLHSSYTHADNARMYNKVYGRNGNSSWQKYPGLGPTSSRNVEPHRHCEFRRSRISRCVVSRYDITIQ